VRESLGYAELEEVTERLQGADDMTPVIVGAAVRSANQSSLCRAAVEMFVSILAAETGNLAMKVMATGGMYLAGGIPLHVLPLLNTGRFVQEFERKGRFSHLLSDVPIHVVLHKTSLAGAARYAAEMMHRDKQEAM
jgi:glucokinase